MPNILFIFATIVLFALSGLPGLLLRPTSRWIGPLHTVLVGFGCMAGIAGLLLQWWQPTEDLFYAAWPNIPEALVGLDALSAFFLVPILLVGFLGALYAQGYWPAEKNPRTASRTRFFWGQILSGMVLLVASRHGILFLLGWETMALSAFFLITTEDEKAECRSSGLIYLIATHAGTLSLFALFSLWNHITGTFELLPNQGSAISPGWANILFAVAFLGFGLKAGMMPLHFWLPGAHANAPSHVSALLSGVMLKMGIYGIVRMSFLLPGLSSVWGWAILLLGILSGILGVVFALAQHDLKRLLAYHSVENIGIILLGLGLALLGRSYHRPLWIGLGMAGALLHVWNHGLFKSLLFLGAGSVRHGTGTRVIDRLGGLSKVMPWTSSAFLLGAVAISGLPPLNGFISEFFLYIAFFKGTQEGGTLIFPAVLGAPALAMIGALAVACFVKVYSAVFLGSPRTPGAEKAHEASAGMRVSMVVLGLLCLLIGLIPQVVLPILQRGVDEWSRTYVPVVGTEAPAGLAAGAKSAVSTPNGLAKALGNIASRGGGGVDAAVSVPSLADLVPFKTLSVILFASVAASLLLLAGMGLHRTRKAQRTVTWDCGYAQPTSRMQYTAASFARSLVELFRWVLKPVEHTPRLPSPFPSAVKLESHVDDMVLDRMLVPKAEKVSVATRWFYRFQQGKTNAYILYMVLIVIILLLSLIPFKEILYKLFILG